MILKQTIAKIVVNGKNHTLNDGISVERLRRMI